jgi:3-methyladenine DNA glycosylase/8-oxoguanine DNA glycosylase
MEWFRMSGSDQNERVVIAGIDRSLERGVDEDRKLRERQLVVAGLAGVHEVGAHAGRGIGRQPDPGVRVEAGRRGDRGAQGVAGSGRDLDHPTHGSRGAGCIGSNERLPTRGVQAVPFRSMAAPARIDIRLRGPGGEPVDLWRTMNSHGFADLPPVLLDESSRTLDLTIRMQRGAPRRVRIGAGRGGFARVELLGDGAPTTSVLNQISRAATHVLRLDHDLSDFYAVAASDADLAWVVGGAGRMLRSPSVWEDVVKTVCTTNCSWSLTTTMVRALVTHLGTPAAGHADEPLANTFPDAVTMAAQPERFYREVVRAGYRAPNFVRLANLVANGEVDLESLGTETRAGLPDDEVERRLLALPGVGPYAAAHIMMTLGRNSRPIFDSWTRPTYARLVGKRRIPTDAQIARRFRRFGPEAGLAFWLFVTRDWVVDEAGATAT